MSAQTDIIASYIIEDDTENPVASAKVSIEELGLSTFTNDKGYFSFKTNLPQGNYLISVYKDGYDSKVFLIQKRAGIKINLKEVRINVNKREAKRRRIAAKKKAKEEREKARIADAKIKEAQQKLREREKELEKQKQKLLKHNTVVVEYDSIVKVEDNPVVEQPIEEEEEVITEVQKKYANILGVDPTILTNKELYNFIDSWMGTPYLFGGETREGIDCSAFTQRLFIKAYDKMYLERMASKQFSSSYTDLFRNLDNLEEGDLLFFGKDEFNITHVGVYLHNNKFVHSTSSTVDGKPGVKISNITDPYWSSRVIAAGRRSYKQIED